MVNSANPMNPNALIPNPIVGLGKQAPNTLGLNQIENFQPVQKFVDDTNTEWTLVKSSFDSTVDIPDPKSIQLLHCWNHEFPNLKTKLYVYVVEGIRQPRVETEQASRILYQWFSPICIQNFNPQMITDKEWLKANVYAAKVTDVRVSILKAICHIDGEVNAPVATDDKLLQVEELNGNIAGNTTGS